MKGFNSFLNGNPLLDYRVDAYQELLNINTGRNYVHIKGHESVELSATMLIEEHSSIGVPDWFGERVVGLGEGKSCEYCGVYCAPGLYRCHRCDAPLGVTRLIAPFEFPFICMEFAYSSSRSERVTGDIRFALTGVFTSDIWQFINGRHWALASIPHTITLDLSCYLCPYCGMANKRGEDCYGCGAGQLPLSEAVNMKRECLYCRSDTAVNGVLCYQCGARLTGETIGHYLGEFQQ